MIALYLLPSVIPSDIDRNRPIVIFDIFRASTSMAAALNSGADEIHPAGSIAEAKSMREKMGDSLLMAGERGGLKIEGYDFGNSPREMISDKISGRKVIFNSTNGTKLLRKFTGFENVCVGSFVCMSATVSYLDKFELDPVICCAGQEGKFSGEDTMAAGMLISRLVQKGAKLDDASEFALNAYEKCGEEWRDSAMNASHGRHLKSIGLEKDLPYCTDVDRFSFVPVMIDDKIVIYNDK